MEKTTTTITYETVVEAASVAANKRLKRLRESEKLTFEALIDAPPRMESRYDTRREDEGMQLGRIRADIEIVSSLINEVARYQTSQPKPSKICLGSIVYATTPWGEQWMMVLETDTLEFLVEGLSFQGVTPRSDIGSSLLGKLVGDTVNTRPGLELTILEIKP